MVVLWVILGAICLVLLLLMMPISYEIFGRWGQTFGGEVSLQTGPLRVIVVFGKEKEKKLVISVFGIVVKKTLHKEDKEDDEGKDKTKNKEQRKKRVRKRPFGISDLAVLNDKGFLEELFKTVKLVIYRILPQKCEVKGTLGFDDPYYTGLLAAVRAAIPGIKITPDFTGEVRDLSIYLLGRFRPVVLLFYVLRFIVSKSGRTVLWKLWRTS